MPNPPLPPPSDYDAILFDAGGTLVELDFPFIAACAAERGVRVTLPQLRRGEVLARRRIDAGARASGGVEGRDADRRFRYFAVVLEGGGVAPEEAAAIADRLEAANAESLLWRVAIDGAAAVLAGLRERGVATGVVSNADGRVEAMLHRLGLAPHLELVLDSHLEGVEKPHPEIFERAVGRLGLAPARTLYVGDIYSIDVVGARGAGLVPVLLDPLGGYPDVDCATIAALYDLLG